MSRDASIELSWAGDLRRFRLGIDQLLVLQERRGCGVFEIAARLGGNGCFVEDVQETIRLGLVGADMEPRAAKMLIDDHAAAGRLWSARTVARSIMLAALMGDEDDPVGKGVAVEGQPGSPPPPSTEPAPPSASRPNKSDE